MIGSGPSSSAALPNTRVRASSQPVGSGVAPGGRPSQAKPPAVGRQRTGTPAARDCARADSSSAASRSASRASVRLSPSGSARLASAAPMATMAITTISSISVKPRGRFKPDWPLAPDHEAPEAINSGVFGAVMRSASRVSVRVFRTSGRGAGQSSGRGPTQGGA